MLWMPHGLIDPDDAERAAAALADGPPVAIRPAGPLALVATAPEPLRAAARAAPTTAPLGDDPDIAALLAAAHHRALCLLAEHLDVLPLRFGAAARDLDAAALQAAAPADGVDPVAVFATLRGAAEYQVKVTADPTLAASRPAPADPAPTAPRGSGRGYLAQKLARRRGAERRRDGLDAIRVAIRTDAAGLGRLAEAPPRAADTVLDLSVLLPRDRAAALAQAGARWAAEAEPLGLRLRLVGPLPPFRFVAADPARPPREAAG